MKKRFFTLVINLLLLTAMLSNPHAHAQSGNEWSGKQASKWYNDFAWLNGLQLKPHPSIDQEAFAKQYHSNKAAWDRAFAFLKETDLNSLTPGKHPIDGENVFVIVTEAPAKDMDNTKWESHRNYNDIHCVLQGKEKIGVTPVSGASLTEAYDAAKDIMFYKAEGKFHLAEPGTFFIFSPKEAHRPSVKVDEDNSVVKKIVVKVRASTSM